MAPVASRLCLYTLLLLFARPVLNLMSNEADKVSNEHCSRHTKAGERNSFLWTLENYPSVYIFGSVHRPYSSIWPQIPRNVKKAFKLSKKIYFEIDLTSPEYLLKLIKCKYLPNKQTLTDVLPSSVLEKLRNYLHFVRSQIPDWLNENEIKEATNADKVFNDMTRNWQRKRPIWILLQLASFNKQHVQSRNIPSLDLYMFLKARECKKSFGHVESAEEHCGLNSLNSSQAIIYLDELLTKYNVTRKEKHNASTGSNLTYHYLCGNLSNYMFSSELDFQTSSPSRLQTLRNFEDSLKKELFQRRNKQIVRKIIQEVKIKRKRKNRKMFFTIGAGHLIGQGSVIDLLKSKGFKPKHILATDSLPRRYKAKQKQREKKLRSKTKTKKKLVKSSSKITSTPIEKATAESTILNAYHRRYKANKQKKKKLRSKTKTKKKKLVKSFPTITSIPTKKATTESIILDFYYRRYKANDQKHKKKKLRSKTKKKKVVKSFPTIMPINLEKEKATTESMILDVYRRSSPVNFGLRVNSQTFKLLMTLFVSWIVCVLIS